MRSKWAWVPLVVVLGVAMYAGTVLATPPSSVKPTVFGVGAFGPIETKGTIGAWSAQMKTTSHRHPCPSEQDRAGGSFGWHSHPGPSFVIVKSGTATVYLGADPSCKPHRFRSGSGFVDRGLDVHAVRNEGKVDLVTVVVSLVPKTH